MACLSRREQWRNVALYSCINCLTYFAAPVVYVGITQATLCAKLGASDTVANLPTTAYFWAAIVPVFVAARFRRPSATRHILAAAYGLLAFAGSAVVVALWLSVPIPAQMLTVIIYGGLAGIGIGLRNVFIWEVVNRGMSIDMRGWAYSLSFGVGPMFAILGSLFAQLILTGNVELPLPSFSQGIALFRFVGPSPEFPANFLALFATTIPVLGGAAILASKLSLPNVEEQESAQRLTTVIAHSAAALGRDRILLLAIIAYVLVDAGSTITNNMSLYNAEISHRSAEQFAGYQNALRFTFKMTAGLPLGWLLVRTNARLGMLVTCAFCLSGVVAALTLSSSTFLVCFGLMGAGELYGVYYLNYIMARSRPDALRQNMAMLQLLSLATSVAPASFGAIADRFSLPASFIVAGCVVTCSLFLIVFILPARPAPLLEMHDSTS